MGGEYIHTSRPIFFIQDYLKKVVVKITHCNKEQLWLLLLMLFSHYDTCFCKES